MRASLENFANDTTMHGASKIILSRGRLRRCIWLLTFIAAWTMFVIQICFVLHNYFTFQKKISIEVVYGGVPFPDITICSNRRQDFYELYKDIRSEQGPVELLSEPVEYDSPQTEAAT